MQDVNTARKMSYVYFLLFKKSEKLQHDKGMYTKLILIFQWVEGEIAECD